MLKTRQSIITTILLLLTCVGYAQLMEKPLPYSPKKSHSPTKSRVKEVQGINGHHAEILPFWDDFSNTQYTPDSSKWVGSSGVKVSHSLGIAPPSIGTVVFDGVDSQGAPYNTGSIGNGPADSLTSTLLDLSALPTSQANSVYLSFFWQLKGNGEQPDREDSLALQFKNESGEWSTFWSVTGSTNNEIPTFRQEIVQIPSDLHHDHFQFRFVSFTNLSGAFDTWLVDYIYMNANRHSGDTAYVDRAIANHPTSLISPYTAMPTEQFFINPVDYLIATPLEVYNLNTFIHAIQHSAVVRDTLSNSLIQVLNDETASGSLAIPFGTSTYVSAIPNPVNFPTDVDALHLETTYSIKTGDDFFAEVNGTDTVFNQKIDYRSNDTVRSITVIDDYFAYDDHEPDFAAGINQNGGKLAYQFVAETRALLTHVDINFPFTQQAGQPIEVMVWESLNDHADSAMFQGTYSVLAPSEIGALSAYELDTPIFVQDTFYIGFEQGTNEFLGVGLDKNTDSGDKMFFNVDGTWRQNEYVQGSFLMRPRFDKTIAANFIPDNTSNVTAPGIFPNPSQGVISIRGAFDQMKVYDHRGLKVSFSMTHENDQTNIDLSGNPKGIYLLQVLDNGKLLFTKRLIID